MEQNVLTIDEIKMIIMPIAEKYRVKSVYLFGSYARGDATGQSDIDLRIDGDGIKSMFGLGAFYQELTEVLKKPVDMVTTGALNHKANADRTKKFRGSIERDEQLIYEKND
ncbi:MAG: nucleotidyltransferase domain-containing protein [Lachnospiraceae bacterium]|nr:nucleotidyltransferase domain-containing protein [Lachnospiraceae bacterium]